MSKLVIFLSDGQVPSVASVRLLFETKELEQAPTETGGLKPISTTLDEDMNDKR